eukprot:Skav213352  [mRNA]  locus=scaffold317:90854:91777:- [translate_table: standard]
MAWESSSGDESVDRKRRRLSLPPLVADLFEDGSEELLLAQAVKVEVVLKPNLRLFALEASRKGQEKVVQQAVDDAAAGHLGSLLDPYGVALWPSALVLSQAVAAYIELNADQRILELGAGCGLASLTAAHLGASHVLASDFRQLPLELLRSAARRQALRIRTQLLDINDLSVPLPPADIVVASDVFYEKTTAEAMAHRVAEAFRRGSVCLIADVGRPNREAFLTQLRQLLPEVATDFSIEGLAIQEVTAVTDAVASAPGSQRSVPVQLLELPGGPAAMIRSSTPGRSIRPNAVGVSSLVESTCWQSC